jgi:hypothetical protein
LNFNKAASNSLLNIPNIPLNIPRGQRWKHVCDQAKGQPKRRFMKLHDEKDAWIKDLRQRPEFRYRRTSYRL